MDADTCRALGFRTDGIIDLSLLGLSPAQIEERRSFIGGSDVNTICRGTPAEIAKLAAFKRGEREPEDLSGQLNIILGNITEPFILALGEQKLGHRVERRGERLHDARRPWMACTLDGWFSDYEGGTRLIQVKHWNAFMTFEQVIESYAHTQIQHELMVSKATAALMFIMIGTSKFDIYEVKPDLDVQNEIALAEEAFWRMVKAPGGPIHIPAVTAKAKAVKPVRLGEVEMEGNNAWAAAAADWLANRDAAATFDQAAKDLKAAMPEKAKRAFGHGVEITASKSGALSIKPLVTPAQEAA